MRALAVCCALVAVACDSSPAQPVTPCPVTIPQEGAACATFPLACEYGTARDVRCNVVAKCEPVPNRYPLGDATWSLSGPESTCVTTSSASCPDRSGPTDTNSNACDHCGTVAIGSVCFYADLECGCVMTSAECESVWACMPPAAGCPTPRPNLGSACDADAALECAYGQAQTYYGVQSIGPGAITIHCVGGTWQL